MFKTEEKSSVDNYPPYLTSQIMHNIGGICELNVEILLIFDFDHCMFKMSFLPADMILVHGSDFLASSNLLGIGGGVGSHSFRMGLQRSSHPPSEKFWIRLG